MDTKYSLTTLLNDLLKLQNNSYQIITALSDVVSSNAETVSIPIQGATGTVQNVIVPSFGAMKNQITRLENDIKSLSGIGDVDTNVQLADGSFRKILVSKLQREAADITNMTLPKQFATKENWFFESFLNPLLYVEFNLSNQIKFNTENVEVSRYILNIDTDYKKRTFQDHLLNKENIAYQDFVKLILDNNITYFLDKSVTPVPPRTLRYWGSFAVTKITDDTVPETINSVTYQKRVLRVQLDKLNYNDTTSQFLGTQSLKIGDSLVVNTSNKNTRYSIKGIDLSTRTVSIELIEGFDPIQIGSDVLSFYGEDESSVSVDVNIGFNEYCVIFIKPIDPDSKIQSVNWSPGVGLYTNDLTITDTTGQAITLANYYQNEVVDFGAYLYSIAKEGVIPSSLGLTPDAPTLSTTNFSVYQVNKHLTETSALTDLTNLQANKLSIQSTIDSLNASISTLTTKIQTTRYSTPQLKAADVNTLSNLIDQKNSQSSLYASTINDINKIGSSNSVTDLTPVYRVRGFFAMPLAKTSDRTAPQEVVQFLIQYRYLTPDGGANQPDQMTFIDIDGTIRRGTFSTWVEVKSDVRGRTVDPITGNITWDVENVENADIVNINCVDIPITIGESVEFRIKSLSEAGWPVSPLESNWTDIVRVDFPTSLQSTTNVTSILDEAKNEQIRIELQDELNSMGVTTHVANSFQNNGKYYAHPSLEIASGFLTTEQNVISLFDKLIDLDTQLANIQALLESTRGILVARVVDDTGLEYPVQNNTTIKLFAGNYKDQVSTLPIQKGVIVTKNYFVKLSNDSASNLELYARFWGSRTSMAQASYTTGGTGYNLNDTDYNSIRRYDYVPLGLTSPDPNDVTLYPFIKNYPEASSQVLGQFIQSRYVSIDGTKNLYGAVGGATYGVYASLPQINGTTPSFATGIWDLEYTANMSGIQDTITNTSPNGSTASGDFIWKGATATTTTLNVVSITGATVSSNYNNTILIHINHPGLDYIISQSNPNFTAGYEIRNSIFGNQPVGSTGSNLQTPLYYTGLPGTFNKIGFEPNDQYLLGPKSVGAYLFLNPNSHTDIVVDGSDSLSVRSIAFGDNNVITIPITFQYRMTDYFGSGDSGLGNVGGILNATRSENITYTKTIGLDVYSNPIGKDRLSFDIELTARYFSKTLISKDIPARTFESAIDDLNQTIKSIVPSTSRNITPNKNSVGGNSNRT